MNAGGWLVMTLAVGGMTSLFFWCVWKVFSNPGSTGHMHAQGEPTPDVDHD